MKFPRDQLVRVCSWRGLINIEALGGAVVGEKVKGIKHMKNFLLVKKKVKFFRPGVVLTADINFRLAGGMLSRGGADTYQNRLELRETTLARHTSSDKHKILGMLT